MTTSRFQKIRPNGFINAFRSYCYDAMIVNWRRRRRRMEGTRS